MEELLTNAFNTGDIKIVAVAAILYLIIYFQRKDTKEKRDDAHDKLDTKITLLEDKVRRLDELNLDTRLTSIETNLLWIKDKLQERN